MSDTVDFLGYWLGGGEVDEGLVCAADHVLIERQVFVEEAVAPPAPRGCVDGSGRAVGEGAAEDHKGFFLEVAEEGRRLRASCSVRWTQLCL